MPDSDILIAKAAALDKHLRRIHEKAQISVERFLADPDLQDVVLFNMQMAIQTCLDIAAHIISEQGWGVPGSNTEMFYILEEKGVIGRPLSEKMALAVGLRNLIVHEYARIELERVYASAREDIDDLKQFIRAILKYFRIT